MWRPSNTTKICLSSSHGLDCPYNNWHTGCHHHSFTLLQILPKLQAPLLFPFSSFLVNSIWSSFTSTNTECEETRHTNRKQVYKVDSILLCKRYKWLWWKNIFPKSYLCFIWSCFWLRWLIWFKCQIIKRCIAVYENGDVWWSYIGVACLVMPSIPIALRFFWQKIREFQSRREADRVICFIKLVLMTCSYICGGFIFFAIYQVIYQLSCTWRNITGTTFEVNKVKYRKKNFRLVQP